jgi:hypothetical protein
VPKPYPEEFRDDVVNVARNREPGQHLKQMAAGDVYAVGGVSSSSESATMPASRSMRRNRADHWLSRRIGVPPGVCGSPSTGPGDARRAASLRQTSGWTGGRCDRVESRRARRPQPCGVKSAWT